MQLTGTQGETNQNQHTSDIVSHQDFQSQNQVPPTATNGMIFLIHRLHLVLCSAGNLLQSQLFKYLFHKRQTWQDVVKYGTSVCCGRLTEPCTVLDCRQCYQCSYGYNPRKCGLLSTCPPTCRKQWMNSRKQTVRLGFQERCNCHKFMSCVQRITAQIKNVQL